MTMEQCSETSAHKIQTPGSHPKERMQHRINKLLYKESIKILHVSEKIEEVKSLINLFQNNYQQDDTYGLSFISGLVVLHSTCFELRGTEHVGERVEYSKRLHSMPEAACTVKK